MGKKKIINKPVLQQIAEASQVSESAELGENPTNVATKVVDSSTNFEDVSTINVADTSALQELQDYEVAEEEEETKFFSAEPSVEITETAKSKIYFVPGDEPLLTEHTLKAFKDFYKKYLRYVDGYAHVNLPPKGISSLIAPKVLKDIQNLELEATETVLEFFKRITKPKLIVKTLLTVTQVLANTKMSSDKTKEPRDRIFDYVNEMTKLLKNQNLLHLIGEKEKMEELVETLSTDPPITGFKIKALVYNGLKITSLAELFKLLQKVNEEVQKNIKEIYDEYFSPQSKRNLLV